MTHLIACVLWFCGFLISITAALGDSAFDDAQLPVLGLLFVAFICAGNAYFAAQRYLRSVR